jgi:acetyl-CoA carboxylase/biotin carboxylase 1
MEAKGCAKPMVWKDSRRHFYWAVRARVARSSVIAQLEKASPETTFEDRTKLLESLAAIDAATSDRDAAQALETLDLKPTLAQLKSDHLMQQMLALASEDEEATVTGLTRLINSLADEGKSSLIAAIQSASRLPGTFTLFDGAATNAKRCLGPPSYSN